MILVVVQYQEMNQDFLGTAMILVVVQYQEMNQDLLAIWTEQACDTKNRSCLPNVTSPTKSSILKYDV